MRKIKHLKCFRALLSMLLRLQALIFTEAKGLQLIGGETSIWPNSSCLLETNKGPSWAGSNLSLNGYHDYICHAATL